jgi:hypothetical protein
MPYLCLAYDDEKSLAAMSGNESDAFRDERLPSARGPARAATT